MKTVWVKYLLLIIAIVSYMTSYGQQKGLNMWYQYLMSAKLEKKNLTLLSQYRSYDFVADSRLFLVAGYLDFEVSKNFKPAFGLMYLNLEPYVGDGSKKIRHEIRPFQQVTFDTDIGRWSLSNRFRVEERFLDNPDQFILRFRYLLSLRIPLNKEGSRERFYGILKNEVRINAINDDTFDSDRITAGIGYRFTKKSAVEVAYINQLETKRTSQYIYLGYRNSFDWRKSSKK